MKTNTYKDNRPLRLAVIFNTADKAVAPGAENLPAYVVFPETGIDITPHCT